MMNPGLFVGTVAEGNDTHPRNSEATVVELQDGTLLLAWMEYVANPRGGHDDAPCNIASVTSSDGGRSWGEYRILKERDLSDANVYSPSLLRLQNGSIALGYERFHNRGSTSYYVHYSRDELHTVSEPVVVWSRSPTFRHVAKSMLRQLSSGRLVLPVEELPGRAWDPDDHSKSICYLSDDGYAWRRSRSLLDLPLRGAEEPVVAELADGSLLMYVRTQLGAIFQSRSVDGGDTWSLPQTTGVRAPESCPWLSRIPRSDDLLLIWNHSLYDPAYDHFGKRTPLTVAVSSDNGNTWEHHKDIESDPEWEFTNPACTFTSQGEAVVTYVASRCLPDGKLGRTAMSLKVAVASMDWLYD